MDGGAISCEEGKLSLRTYVRTLAEFAHRRLGTDLGLETSDGTIGPQLGVALGPSGSDGRVENETNGRDEGSNLKVGLETDSRKTDGGWGHQQPVLVQEQVGQWS